MGVSGNPTSGVVQQDRRWSPGHSAVPPVNLRTHLSSTALAMHPALPRMGIFEWCIAAFLFGVAALEATEYWYLSTYIAYATLPIVLIGAMLRPIGTVVRIPVFWLMLCFLVWSYLVSTLAEEQRLALANTWYMTKVWLVALVLAATTFQYKQVTLYLKAILLGALVCAVIGAVLGYATARAGGERVLGITRQPNAFGTTLFHGLLAAMILYPSTTPKWKTIIGLYVSAAFVALLGSGSRGAAVAALTALVAYALLEPLGHCRTRPIALLRAVAMICVPLLLATWAFPASPLVSRIGELLEGGHGATSGRWEIYEQAWDLFRSHTMLGLGMGTFSAYSSVAYTHTTFLDLLVGGGVPAFLLYYGLYERVWKGLTRLVKTGNRTPRWRRTLNAWRSALVALIVHGAFTAVQFQKIPTYLIAMMAGFVFRYSWELSGRVRRSSQRSPARPESAGPACDFPRHECANVAGGS